MRFSHLKTFCISIILTTLAAGISYGQTNTFPNSGYVGIGTTNPDYLLEVSGPGEQLKIDAVGAGNDAIIFFDAAQDEGTNYNVATIIGDAGSSSGFAARLNFNIIDGDGSGWNQALTIKSTPGNLSTGYVGIGTSNPTELFTVAGTAKAEEVIVTEDVGADFVFKEDYSLLSLAEIESFIQTNKHLPEIPSAEKMKSDGVKVGDLQMKLLQKIEELTLYVIELGKSDRAKAERIEQLEQKLEKLSARQ